MKKQTKVDVTRRGFIGSAAAVAALSIVPLSYACSNSSSPVSETPIDDGKPNSKFGGVQCGAITYSFRGLNGVDETIAACVNAGVSSIELMGSGLEEAVGAPSNPVQRRFGPPPAAAPVAPGGAPSGPMPRFQPQPLTEEELVAEAKYNEELAAWRAQPDVMDKWTGLAKRFSDAGVEVHILKWTAGDTDELLDYSFNVAKMFGAVGITIEGSEESCQSLGKAAERNGMLAIYHQHGQYAEMTTDDIDRWLAYSPANRLNFDTGHYVGFGYDNSTKLTPIEFIDKYADRIASVHFKDKTKFANEYASNQNQVWGQGETPVREILQHIQKNHSQLFCDIELEYSVPQWSDSVKEVGICIRYMREALI